MSQFVPFRQLTREQWGNLGKVGAIVASLLFLAIFIFQASQSGGLGNDFRHFYGAAHSMLNGENPYLDRTDYSFLSPLWVAVPYLTVATFPTRTAALLPWLLEGLLLIAGIEFFAVRLISSKKVPLWAWVPLYLATFIFTNNGWMTGQPTIVMTLLIYVAFWFLVKRDQPFWAGVFGFVAFTFKPQVAILLAAVLAVWCLRKGFRSYWWGCLVSVVIGLAVTIPFLPTWPYDVFATYTPGYMGYNAGYDRWQKSTMIDWLQYDFQVSSFTANLIDGLLIAVALAFLARFFWAAWHNRLTLLELLIVTDAIEMGITLYTRDYDYPLLILPVFWVVLELTTFEKRQLAKIFGFAILAFCVIYYLRGGSNLYQMYAINLSVMLLTVWRIWLRLYSRPLPASTSKTKTSSLGLSTQA